MVRVLTPCLLVFLLLTGCASLKAKRVVIENTFYSSYPEIQIKIDSEFEYIGETKEAKTRQAQDSTFTGTLRSNWYIFVQVDEEQTAKKAVIVQIKKAPTYFVSDIYGRAKNYYERGTCKLGGVSWQYYSRLVYPNMSGAVTRFITDQGYVVPQCVIMKSFSKVCGPKNNYLVTIVYGESPPTSDYACNSWKSDSELAYSQQEYLEQFKSNAEKSFAIEKLRFSF